MPLQEYGIFTPEADLAARTVVDTGFVLSTLPAYTALYVVRFGAFASTQKSAMSSLVGWPGHLLRSLSPVDPGPLPSDVSTRFIRVEDFWDAGNDGWIGQTVAGNLSVAYQTRPNGATEVPAVYCYIDPMKTDQLVFDDMAAAYEHQIDLGNILRPTPGLPTYLLLTDDGT